MKRNNNVLQRAFKNQKGSSWIGQVICWFKGWNYWHEEIVFPVCIGKPWSNKVVTSDPSKGVSSREARYSHPDRWQFIDVPKYTIKDLDALWRHFKRHEGQKYGWLDIITTQILFWKINNKKQWFCDEICRHLLCIKPEAVGAQLSKKEALQYYYDHS
jgi:hypothetical protein